MRGSKPWSTDALAFNLSILRVGHARLTGATVDGQPVQATIDDQTIIVPLDPPLAPGGSVVVGLDYTRAPERQPEPRQRRMGLRQDRGFCDRLPLDPMAESNDSASTGPASASPTSRPPLRTSE